MIGRAVHFIRIFWFCTSFSCLLLLFSLPGFLSTILLSGCHFFAFLAREMFFFHLRRHLLVCHYIEVCPQLIRPAFFMFFMYAASCMIWYFSFVGWILPSDASGLILACVVLNYLFYQFVRYQLICNPKRSKKHGYTIKQRKMQRRILKEGHLPLMIISVFLIQYLISTVFYFQNPNVLQYYFQLAIFGRESSRGSLLGFLAVMTLPCFNVDIDRGFVLLGGLFEA